MISEEIMVRPLECRYTYQGFKVLRTGERAPCLLPELERVRTGPASKRWLIVTVLKHFVLKKEKKKKTARWFRDNKNYLPVPYLVAVFLL